MPLLFVADLPKTINEINSWVSTILKAFVAATENILDAVILNESTYGVFCGMKWNYTLCVDYFSGETSQISLPDTNHNIKIFKYQIIGRKYPASFEFYVYDPWLLKLSEGFPKEVIRVEYYAYGVDVL